MIFSKTLSFIFCFTFISSVFATHGQDMEISYRWKSDSTYEFTLMSFQNCGAITPSSLALRYSSNSQSVNSTFILNKITDSNLITTPNIPFDCNNPDSICREQNVFRGIWTSPRRANDWIFSFQLCCRIGKYPSHQYGVQNIEYGTVWMQCGLNNLDFPDAQIQNISPLWHNPVPNIPGHLNDTLSKYSINTLCQGVQYQLDQSVKEYQGDSVAYSFYWPQISSGDSVKYRAPYSFNNPIPNTNGPVTIDANTGIVSIKPNSPDTTGYFVLGIQATEFRNGIQMGYVRRELTIHITDSVVTGLTEYNRGSMEIYPNPSSGILNIILERKENVDLNIYNILGNLVFNEKIGSDMNHVVQIPVSLENGVYFVMVTSKSKVYTNKIILNR